MYVIDRDSYQHIPIVWSAFPIEHLLTADEVVGV